MTPKQKTIKLAESMSLTIFKSDNEIHVDAPFMYCFDNELHCLICDSWQDVIDRVKLYGVHKCEDKECDTCQHTEDRKSATDYAIWMGWELIYGSPRFNSL